MSPLVIWNVTPNHASVREDTSTHKPVFGNQLFQMYLVTTSYWGKFKSNLKLKNTKSTPPMWAAQILVTSF